MVAGVGSARVLVVVSVLAVGMVLPVAVARAAGLPDGCTGAVTSGADSLVCMRDLGAGAVIDAGAGDDVIVVEGDVLEGAVVKGGVGNDRISAYNVGRFVCPAGKLGADDVNGGVLDGGPGEDALTVGGQARPQACDKTIPADIPGGNVGRHGVVRGGEGIDTITVGSVGYVFQPDEQDPSTTSRAHGGRVAGDAGDDVITVGCASLGENPPSEKYPDGTDGVFGGASNDAVTLTRIVGAADVFGDAYQPIPGAGDDTITVGPMTGGWIHGGPGNDSLTAGQLGSLAWLFGDDGNDTLNATDLIGPTAYLFGGDGDDVLSVDTMGKFGLATYDSVVMGGNGHDKIDVGLVGNDNSEIRGDGLAGDTDPNHGTGQDTITVGTNKGYLFAGNDDDTLTVEDNEQFLDAGAGNDTCTIATQGPNATTTGCEQH